MIGECVDQPEPEHEGDSRTAARRARVAARRKRERTVAFAAGGALLIGAAIIVGVILLGPGPAKPSGTTAATNTPESPVTSIETPSQPASTVATAATANPSMAIGSSTATQSAVPSAPSAQINSFSVADTKTYLRVLSNTIGVRAGGSAGERRAARYIESQLTAMGYEPRIESFKLTNGKTSQNVTAVLKGRSERTVILGGHYDTKRPAPGANDNGSGSAALLAIAKELADERLPYSIEFVWFGTEEMIDANGDHHHYGSRYHARSLSTAEKARTDAMISVDMIGYGPEFRVRTMGVGPQGLRTRLLAFAKRRGLPLSYMQDTSSYGYSDHEPFERAGIPSAWIEWRDDPTYHSADDDYAHIKWNKIRQAGELVLEYMRSLTLKELDKIRAS